MKRKILILFFTAALVLAGFAHPATQPAAAQGVVWQAQFYDNQYLSGNPVFTTQYNSLDLNWGTTSPGGGVPFDNFSARIATDTYFAAGTYRFYLLADDGVQLWIDFPPTKQPSLTTFDAPRPGQMLTVDVALEAGSHHIQVDFREVTGDAYVYLRWANLATNPNPPAFSVPTTVGLGSWTAQYFSNATLTGSPVSTVNEAGVSHAWGDTAPASGVPADNFSVRWISIQNLTGGNYELRVQVDDGVRVWVNNGLVIDEWHGASGQTYVRSLPLGAGQHAFTVEYYEASGAANIDFRLTLPGTTAPPPAQPPANPTGATVTVIVYRLNVRQTPSLTGQRLTQVSQGQTYAVLARSADNGWFQINANGIIGWVSSAYVQLANAAAIPVTGATPATTTTGYVLTARLNLNIRSGPGVTYTRLGYLPRGVSAEVVGRNSASTWYQIKYNSLVGWISGFYADLQPGADLTRIPVTG
ncbi:MAG: SH3 domain-containing protein [Chloroflexi bacterium]|nr:SH3 domain-containing protein [Chloroflexota bacterium]